jgi:hypothetical protein
MQFSMMPHSNLSKSVVLSQEFEKLVISSAMNAWSDTSSLCIVSVEQLAKFAKTFIAAYLIEKLSWLMYYLTTSCPLR